MLGRFTEKARRTVFFARWEASQYSSSSIEPEHLLMALFKDRWLIAGLLGNTSEPEFRGEIFSGAFAGEATQKIEVPFRDASKRILNHSAEEADQLLDSHIGNEHLLLGILLEKKCNAARALSQRGVKVKALRNSILQIPGEERKLKGAKEGGS